MNLSSLLEDIDHDWHIIFVRYAGGTRDLAQEIMPIIKKVNLVLNMPELEQSDRSLDLVSRVRCLGLLLLKLHDYAKRNDFSLINASMRIEWLCSKLTGAFYYPYDHTIGDFREDETHLRGEIDFGDVEVCQGKLPDCSFVAAVQALTVYGQSVLRNCLTPSLNGTYSAVFRLNGCKRSQVVSDTPYQGIQSWPGLLETAFLQLHGGEKYNGSNFADDCFLLSGFVPEYLPIEKLTPAKLEELCQYFNNKSLVMALGVGKLTDDEVKAYDLVPNHDYSVTSLDNHSVTLRDPMSTRTVTLKLEDLYDRFRTVYLNWNTDELFTYTNKVTFFVEPKELDNSSLIEEVQFFVRCKGKFWVLLERHLPESYSCIKSIDWFDHDRRKWRGETSCATPVSNSRFTLAKMDLQGYQDILAVLRSQTDRRQFYTIHAYSDDPISLQMPKKMPTLKSCWSVSESGGNISMDTFGENPQFKLVLDEDCDCEIAVFAERVTHVNLTIFTDTGNFRRVTTVDNATMLSGQRFEYDAGSNSIHRRLSAGTYYVVCSTFNAGELGPLRIAASHGTLSKITSSLGAFTKKLDTEIPCSGQIIVRRPTKVVLKAVGAADAQFNKVTSRGRYVFVGSNKQPLETGAHAFEIGGNGHATIEVWSDYQIEVAL